MYVTSPSILNNVVNEPPQKEKPEYNVEPIASTSLRPLPKARPRKVKQSKRGKIKSAVLIDTSVKDEIAALKNSKKVKRRRSAF
jgi:hypothetical protein